MTAKSGLHRRQAYCPLPYWLATPLLFLCFGCPVAPPTPAGGTSQNGGTSGTGSTNSGTLPVIEPRTNTSIETAAPLDLSTGELRFLSTIRNAADINVFQLGSLAPGDRVFADIRAQTGNLDAVAAVFDASAEMVDFNDDRDPNDVDPLIDFVLRADAGPYYLAITGFPGERTAGEYVADVRIERQVGVPPPRNQVVFLDWRGGSGITIPDVGTFDLPPFSATDMGLPAGQTQGLQDKVEQIVRDRYAGFDITLLSSDHDAVPTAAHSTVYFDGFDQFAFGISQDVDSYNQNPSDSSLIFAGSFQGAFSHTPSFDELALALGNTVAHEIGHLLGMVHTHECPDLMDTSCVNDRLLVPQQFSTAPIDGSVLPFGQQPESDLLTWILGLAGS